MTYDFDYIRFNVLEDLIRQRSMTNRQFEKLMWGDDPKNHRTIKEFEKEGNIKLKTACQICAVLGVELDYFLLNSDKKPTVPSVTGNNNVVNSSYVNHDVNTLKSEIRALKMVIEEKNKRLEDLKKVNEELGKRLDMVLQLGHITDK